MQPGKITGASGVSSKYESDGIAKLSKEEATKIIKEFADKFPATTGDTAYMGCSGHCGRYVGGKSG